MSVRVAHGRPDQALFKLPFRTVGALVSSLGILKRQVPRNPRVYEKAATRSALV